MERECLCRSNGPSKDKDPDHWVLRCRKERQMCTKVLNSYSGVCVIPEANTSQKFS